MALNSDPVQRETPLEPSAILELSIIGIPLRWRKGIETVLSSTGWNGSPDLNSVVTKFYEIVRTYYVGDRQKLNVDLDYDRNQDTYDHIFGELKSFVLAEIGTPHIVEVQPVRAKKPKALPKVKHAVAEKESFLKMFEYSDFDNSFRDRLIAIVDKFDIEESDHIFMMNVIAQVIDSVQRNKHPKKLPEDEILDSLQLTFSKIFPQKKEA